MTIAKQMAAGALVALLALAVRLPGLGSFMTVDEENWMLRSAGFYHNLFRRADFGGTFMTTHPGAAAMWVTGAGMVAQEARVGFDADTSNLSHFRLAATLPVALTVSLLIGVATFFLMSVFGMGTGLVGGILLALEPYFVGMSQIAHLDMLLALFMLNSVLAFFLGKRTAAGIFAGLALSTKLLLGLWLFVFFGIFLVARLSRKIASGDHGTALWPRFERSVSTLGFILGIAFLTFYVAWPALWFTADLGRSFERDVPSVIQDAHVAIEESQEPIAPVSFYLRTLLGRTTPFVLILVAGSLIILGRLLPHFAKATRGLPSTEYSRSFHVIWLFIYVVGFLVLITFAAKKADRYALPALITLPVIAGWALGKTPILHLRSVKWGAILLGVLLLAQVFIWSPHTIAYNSPLFDVRPLSQQGWGEGLEEAAAWLNAHPLAGELYVASWYPSVFQNYFRGKTFSLSSRADNRVSYVVLYRNMFGRSPDTIASDVLDEYRGKWPEHVVVIGGVPYVWVYATDSTEIFKQHAGEIFGDTSVGQLVPVRENQWHAIEIGMANFSNRTNTQDVTLHIRESLESGGDIRTARVNAREIHDGVFHRFAFEPIADSAGKTFYVFLESPTSRPGNAVTVRFSTSDILPGEMVKSGEVNVGRDIAWRIPR